MRAWKIRIAVVLSAGVLAVSPKAARAPFGPDGPTLVSVSDEIELGRQAQTEVRQQTPAIQDAGVNRYVDGVFRRLTRHASGPSYPYSVSVANYVEVNAFALPGGPVWVHRGAVEAAREEAQLAGVLAHEIAHIERRHVARQITNQTVAGGLLALLGRALPADRKGQIGRVAAAVAAQGAMLKFSRDDEREADREGTRLLHEAGWDAHGLADFLVLLRDRQGRDPSSVETFLSNHPAPGERAADLRASRLPAGGRRDTEKFQRVRARLRSMPPAHRMQKR